MKHVIIGMGEVGKGLFEVLAEEPDYRVGWHDLASKKAGFAGSADAMHVAIPYSKDFVYNVKRYIEIYKPKLVIVHSTVKLGTCDREGWIHSPVRGVHPNIAGGIKTFVKYFGGKRSEEAADIFSRLCIKTVAVPYARDCEAAKIWDTTQYGWMIVLNKAIHDWCRENNVSFELAYSEFNRTYNEGYRQLGRQEVARPYLKHMPGPIGGHCVMPNLDFIAENPVADFIACFDAQLKKATNGHLEEKHALAG